MDENHPNYYQILTVYLTFAGVIQETQSWIDAYRDRGEKIPPYALQQRAEAIVNRNTAILEIDPNYDFEKMQSKSRMLLGVKYTATVAGKPTIPELIGIDEIFSVSLGKTPITIPLHNSETGLVELNLAVGNTLNITFTPQQL